MAKAPTGSLFRYYEQNQFNPVTISLEDQVEWKTHVDKRRNLYNRHLGIPLQLLAGRSVLEFGCNSGENALVLASYGANLTLVEPNSQVLPRLRKLFSDYGFENRLTALIQQEVALFKPEQVYDLVIAEGFLNTLGDRDEILKKICRLVSPEGLAVISFDDRIGHFLELTRRLVLTRACRLEDIDDMHGESSLELAKALFAQDFGQINVSRPFEAWWGDVLVSPFLATRYLWSYQEILPLIEEEGCEFYSSSPKWVSTDRFDWYKNVVDRHSRHRQLLDEWAKNFPYFVTGFLPSGREIESASGEVVDSVVRLISDLSDYVEDPSDSVELPLYPQQLDGYLKQSEDARLVAFNEEMRRLYDALHSSQTNGLISAYHGSEVIRNLWGTPCHYMCIRTPSDSTSR